MGDFKMKMIFDVRPILVLIYLFILLKTAKEWK
jgi:hypothetical protein